MKSPHAYYLLLFALLTGCISKTDPSAQNKTINIVPVPQEMEMLQGCFTLSNKTAFIDESNFDEMLPITEDFKNQITLSTGFTLEKTSDSKNTITLKASKNELPPEAYILTVIPENIVIEASGRAGLFYGLQSLKQLFPAEIFSSELVSDIAWEIPALKIKDFPRFSYRGLHLDVGRHFTPADSVKKFIDLMAQYKYNTFHWHLTEDQGWRIEIKKYPKLTEIGAWRKETLIGHYSDKPHQFDGKKYGGFYTQEEVKEIVAYAHKKCITIIPEIEMPGHSLAALAAYPELGCTDEQYEVATKWGVFNEVYCPNEKTFQFLQDVLDEVIPLFPGKYIHIGGDECPKKQWKESALCQNIMKKEGLKDEHELQSWFIRRIEKYINGKGKQIIGWDEILEGGLAPGATVMSWRGMDGGIAAAKQGHDVIMTPSSHCYFDYYQTEPNKEPLAIGGLTNLKKVYEFEPVPKELNQEQAKYIIGAQGNLWTEYMPTFAQVLYMAYPRALALAEVNWSQPNRKDWISFNKRLLYQKQVFKQENIAIGRLDSKISIHTISDKNTGDLLAVLDCDIPGIEVRYTTHGDKAANNSPLYHHPFIVQHDIILNAGAFSPEGDQINRLKKNIFLHEACGITAELTFPYSDKYPANGAISLCDGLKGGDDYADGYWQGFNGVDLEARIEFPVKKEISKVEIGFFQKEASWIFLPQKIEIWGEFGLGRTQKLAELINEIPNNQSGSFKKDFILNFDPTEVKGIIVKAIAQKKCPDWHPGAGFDAWLFCDEIIVR